MASSHYGCGGGLQSLQIQWASQCAASSIQQAFTHIWDIAISIVGMTASNAKLQAPQVAVCSCAVVFLILVESAPRGRPFWLCFEFTVWTAHSSLILRHSLPKIPALYGIITGFNFPTTNKPFGWEPAICMTSWAQNLCCPHIFPTSPSPFYHVEPLITSRWKSYC